MERDFLGIHGKDSKEENRGRRQDSAFLGGSPLQRPFSNNLASTQQFMSFKRSHDDGTQMVQFDKLHSSSFPPISTVDAFEATRKPSPVLVQQRSFSLERQDVHFAMQSQGTDSSGAAKHPSNDTRTYPVVSADVFPMTTSGLFFHVHGAPSIPNLSVSPLKQQLSVGATPPSVHSSGSNVGSYAPGNAANSLPMTAQLTMFYAGSVNVYDEIPLDKAQAIMFLASAESRSNSNSNVLNQRPETPLLDSNKGLGPDSVSTNANQMRTPTPHSTPSCSGLSKPISITSQNAMHSARRSINSITEMMASTALQTAPTNNNQNEPSKTVGALPGSPSSVTVMARAVPQARRASLARFLEKRKERVTNTMPYSCTK